MSLSVVAVQNVRRAARSARCRIIVARSPAAPLALTTAVKLPGFNGATFGTLRPQARAQKRSSAKDARRTHERTCVSHAAFTCPRRFKSFEA